MPTTPQRPPMPTSPPPGARPPTAPPPPPSVASQKPPPNPGADPQETKMRIGEEDRAAMAKVAQQEGQQTIADEQRERSDEMAAMGVEKWKEAHDQRSDEDKRSRPVTGVGTTGDARTLEPGSGAGRR